MPRSALAVALAVSLASPLAAQSIRDCDTFEANARNLIFPVERSTATFANGAVRLIGLDTGGEPTCCSSHLMVILPAGAGDPGESCVLVSREGTSGWSGIDVGAARSSYDPSSGLRVAIPAGLYDGSGTVASQIVVTINQSTGRVTAE